MSPSITPTPTLTPPPTPNPDPEELFYLFTERNGSKVACAHVESSFTFFIDYYVEKKVGCIAWSLPSLPPTLLRGCALANLSC